jgi:hypothetical protein
MKIWMMIKRFNITSILCLGCFLVSGTQLASASDLGDNLTSNVFNFQKKLANSGNAQSQNKLGEMFEAGNGVEKDLEQARHWYQEAAKNGYEPAVNRLTYLDIKTKGFNKEKHSAWVTEIKKQADAKNRDSMLLLAQMYREGIVVDKDLAAAKQILDTLSISGNMSIDNEIVLLDAEIRASKKHEQELAAQREAEAKQRAEAERQQKQQDADKAQQNAAKAQLDAAKAKADAAAKQETAEEKRKRYEAVMKKLKEEQRVLQEQQKWAEEREK